MPCSPVRGPSVFASDLQYTSSVQPHQSVPTYAFYVQLKQPLLAPEIVFDSMLAFECQSQGQVLILFVSCHVTSRTDVIYIASFPQIEAAVVEKRAWAFVLCGFKPRPWEKNDGQSITAFHDYMLLRTNKAHEALHRVVVVYLRKQAQTSACNGQACIRPMLPLSH